MGCLQSDVGELLTMHEVLGQSVVFGPVPALAPAHQCVKVQHT